jgi:hypothetical protein
MAKSKTIRVTPNVKKCIEVLKEAVKAMPSGDLKEKAEGALRYLSRTIKGEPQPQRGMGCPGASLIIKL